MEDEKSSTLKDLLLIAGGALGAETIRYFSSQSDKEYLSSEAIEGLTRVLNFPEPKARNSLLQFVSGISQSSVKTKILAGLNKMDDKTLKALADSADAQKQLVEMVPCDIGDSFRSLLKSAKEGGKKISNVLDQANTKTLGWLEEIERKTRK